METLDLKKNEFFLGQYVVLRNRYCDLLLSLPVQLEETRNWLQKPDVEIFGLVENGILLGVVILYLAKNGEIAFFVDKKGKGIGTKLLETVERIAHLKNQKTIWAWVLSSNIIAQKVFEKRGFQKKSLEIREFKNEKKSGILFEKVLA